MIVISPYVIRILNGQIRWDRMDGGYTMELTGSELELVWVYSEIKHLNQINDQLSLFNDNRPM